MPTHTKVNFAPQTIYRIAENPKVIGFKDSSANLVYFQSVMHIMKDHPNFSMLVGPEEVTGEVVLMGGNGGINGGANMFPKLYVALYNAAKEHNFEELYRLQKNCDANKHYCIHHRKIMAPVFEKPKNALYLFWESVVILWQLHLTILKKKNVIK